MNIEEREKDLVSHLKKAEEMLRNQETTSVVKREHWITMNRKIIAEREGFLSQLNIAEMRAKVRRIKNSVDRIVSSNVKK